MSRGVPLLLARIPASAALSPLRASLLSSRNPARGMAELLRTPPSNPPPLKPAASLIVCASEEGADPEKYKVLMIQRAQRGPFGGLTVYPGGAIEPVDSDPLWRKLLLETWERNGVPKAEAEAVLNRKTNGDGIDVGLEYYIGAVRESFEEVGLLLSYPRRPTSLTDSGLQEIRKEVHASAPTFPKVFEGTGMAPDVGRLVHWANWNTPTVEHKRFRTQFFLTYLPYPIGRAHSRTTSADGTETLSLTWMTPQEALDKFNKGEVRMFPPQFYQLTELAKFYPTASHLRPFVEGKKERTPFERAAFQPEFYKDGDHTVAVLPGDALHSATEKGTPADSHHRLVLSYGSSKPGTPGGITGMEWDRQGKWKVSCDDPKVKL
ncbi:hypothetical protein DFJ74DRAFT_121506 [Hyaloraphidium curvatum]|nr:hypothetical protein DFJ74DRAFT_462385 [Hyaloraphidium curvatum]KAI9021352.1 hypothetical protein DFJ74DRAFT_121506 [Hyaloraphidium curvatum]